MGPYSPSLKTRGADQAMLPRALTHIYDLYSGLLRNPNGAAFGYPLKPGLDIVIMPTGEIYVLRGGHGHPSRPSYPASSPDPCRLDPLSPIRQDLAPRNLESLLGYSAHANLSCVMHAAPVIPSNLPRAVRDLWFQYRTDAPFDSSKLRAITTSLPRLNLDRRGAVSFVHEIMHSLWIKENDLCSAALRKFPSRTMTSDLRKIFEQGHVMGLVKYMRDYPSTQRLDVAIVPDSYFNNIRTANPEFDHDEDMPPNMLRIGECAILANRLASNGELCLLSSRHGPTFLYGHTVVRCMESELAIGHYCGIADPHAQSPALPIRLRDFLNDVG